jgi:ubiquinone/menaquinone biosynthesis C-methylase UbiE
MTWEEVIISARKNPDFQEVIYQSYLGENLVENVERFRLSEEFIETLRMLGSQGQKSNLKLLDIGSGNGISCVSFALNGYEVTSVEPDKGMTTGTGAISKLVEHFDVRIQILNAYAEHLPLPDQCFNIVYLRQTLHHASDLGDFLKECHRVLKTGGKVITVRDHVIYGKRDKDRFLAAHPFHKLYKGENAYKLSEYTFAFKNAGFQMLEILGHYDSVINYFPLSKKDYEAYPEKMKAVLREKLIKKIGFLGRLNISQWVFRYYKGMFPSWYNEKLIPGRLYSFIAVKR